MKKFLQVILWSLVIVALFYGIQLAVQLPSTIAATMGAAADLDAEKFDEMDVSERSGYLTELTMERLPILELLVISSALTSLVVLLVWRRRFAESRIFSFKRVNIKQVLLILVLAVAGQFFVQGLISMTNILEVDTSYTEHTSVLNGDFLWQILAIGIAGPINEEIVFRGLGFSKFAEKIGVGGGVVFSALVFGLIHGNITQSSYAFLLGIMLALVMLWSGSFWTAALLHIGFNSASVLLVRLAELVYGDALYDPVVTEQAASSGDGFTLGMTFVSGLFVSAIMLWFWKRRVPVLNEELAETERPPKPADDTPDMSYPAVGHF